MARYEGWRGVSVLIDDAARPTLRERIGELLSTSSRAEFAVANIRVAAIDLTAQEIRNVRCCRILLGRLDARALTDFGYADAGLDERMNRLLWFLESGRVEIRSAGVGAWFPDFSIYSGPPRGGSACLIGAHYFRQPLSLTGPSFTAMMVDARSVATARARFDALWAAGHDVLEPVISAVHSRHSFSAA